MKIDNSSFQVKALNDFHSTTRLLNENIYFNAQLRIFAWECIVLFPQCISCSNSIYIRIFTQLSTTSPS